MAATVGPGHGGRPVPRRLDRAFRASVALKGLDGLLEVIGGLALLLVSPRSFGALARTLTQHELSEDPDDAIARHLLRVATGLRHGTAVYAGIYLLAHGMAKVVVVAALLRDRLWAYPAMIGLLGTFIAYQLYRISSDPSFGLSLLTAFDIVVVWLTVREYRAKRAMLGPWPPPSDPGSPSARW